MSKTKSQVWATTKTEIAPEDVLKKLDSLGSEESEAEVTSQMAASVEKDYEKEVAELKLEVDSLGKVIAALDNLVKANDEERAAAIRALDVEHVEQIKQKDIQIDQLKDMASKVQTRVLDLTKELAITKDLVTVAEQNLRAVSQQAQTVNDFAPLICGHPQPCRGIRDTGEQYCRWCEDVNRLTLINRRLTTENEQLGTQITALSSSNITGEGALKKAKQTAYLYVLEMLKRSSSVDEAVFVLGKRLQDLIA